MLDHYYCINMHGIEPIMKLQVSTERKCFNKFAVSKQHVDRKH